jgi:hypothetical protein
MLRGERVTLRPTERADLPKLWELLEDMDVAILAEGGPVVPTSLSRYEARFDRQIVVPGGPAGGYSIVEGRARDDLLMAAIRDDSSPRT